MNKTIELEEAQATLGELIDGLQPDEEVLIMRNQRPVAKLVPSAPVPKHRVPGLMKGKLTVVAEDDVHLEGFKDYMP